MRYSKHFFVLVLAAMFTLLPAASRAASTTIDVGPSTFTISELGDLTLVLKDGEPEAIVARGQEFKGMGVYFAVNGAPYTGNASLTSNLTLLHGTMPLKFEHDGTLYVAAGDHSFTLTYEGVATKTKDMATHTKTLNSYGDFVVTEGKGAFEKLVGVKGTYSLSLVCQGMPGEHPKVGAPVEVTFSAMGE
jgi:hypothetical protein